MKARVIRMALAVDYIDEYLKQKGVEFSEIADVCDKLISFEVIEKPIDEFKLDELAEEYATKYATPHTSQFVDMINGFKTGYRKAKEE